MLEECAWTWPPRLEAAGRLRLPPAELPAREARDHLWASLETAGRLRVRTGSFREIAFNAAAGAFALTNGSWKLTDVQVDRPEGTITGGYAGGNHAQDFRLHFRSAVLPDFLIPLLPPGPRGFLELWRFTEVRKIRPNHGITRTVPATDGKYVFSMDPKAGLHCLNAATGKQLWYTAAIGSEPHLVDVILERVAEADGRP